MEKIKQVLGERALTTSDLIRRTGVGVSVAFLKKCGVTPIHQSKNGAYWRECDFPAICYAIAKRINEIGASAAK